MGKIEQRDQISPYRFTGTARLNQNLNVYWKMFSKTSVSVNKMIPQRWETNELNPKISPANSFQKNFYPRNGRRKRESSPNLLESLS